jgi:hypothetical protein
MNRTIFFYIFLIIVLIVFNSCKKDKSECLTCPPPPPDTTSHAIQWQLPDTLGTQGIIRDVWVFDRNNAWAVGEIYLNDSTGKPDMVNPYNAAHWDGSKWNVLKVQFYTFCGQAHTNAYQAYAIWAFSPTDIWIASGSQIARMNGTAQTGTDCLSVSVNKIWGLSGNVLYTAGALGQIGFYNGGSWTKMTSNTTVDLQDIWGIDGSHIWATGTNTGDGHCVVLQCNGSNWSTLYDSNNQPAQSQFQFGTVWTNTSSSLYLDGGSGLHLLTLNNLNIGSQINTGLTYVGSCIRGINQNDIYVVSTGGEVSHYNGSSWHLYPELQSIGGNNAWWRSVHPTNDFVIISGELFTSLNSFPVIVRGYR